MLGVVHISSMDTFRLYTNDLSFETSMCVYKINGVCIVIEKESMDSRDIQIMAFTLMLKKFPVLFSRTRKTRKNENSALESLKTLYEGTFGREITCDELITKIDDMKKTVTEKTQLKSGVNREMNLQVWENIILDLMDGKSKPSRIRLKGALIRGLSTDDDEEENKPKKIKLANPLDEYETHETKQLSNEQLKRYVLLQQLRVLKLKEEKLNRSLTK
ncbi:uncharacterized protein LOC123307352 [Coccinella septempunctata]|uniref:uncharacterized protein LOC123307352 n=1 Tax=Coccinella septempunctata TaxID=41139 RepID=UPI001D07ECD2|nr:uncharacterized protein LOC123307352 [Coccinella septempunctata]